MSNAIVFGVPDRLIINVGAHRGLDVIVGVFVVVVVGVGVG